MSITLQIAGFFVILCLLVFVPFIIDVSNDPDYRYLRFDDRIYRYFEKFRDRFRELSSRDKEKDKKR